MKQPYSFLNKDFFKKKINNNFYKVNVEFKSFHGKRPLRSIQKFLKDMQNVA